MLHEFQIGMEFAEIFLDQKIKQLTDSSNKQLKTKSTSQESIEWLTHYVQLPYFQYLQRLAVNIQVFHSCKVQQYPILLEQQKFIDIQTKLIWLFKISNLVSSIYVIYSQANCGLGQMEIIKQALTANNQDMLLKEIVLVYWSDIIVYYNFLSKEVLQLLDYYRHLAINVCLQFYELYLSLFHIRNSISDLYKYKKHFDRDNVIKQPKWFDVNKPTHKDIEEYMIKQRLEQATSKKGTQTDRDYIEHKKNKTQIGQIQFEKMVRLNLNKIKSLNEESEFGKNNKEKVIQTHRASRRDDSNADEEDFEELKKILQSQNLQQRLADRKQETASKPQSQQVSFQKDQQFA